jgi:SAM-dependent methyltransferase
MDARLMDEVRKIWDEVIDYEYSLVENAQKSLGAECHTLVDVGCGSLGLLGRRGDRLAALQAHSLGIDVDREALATNPNVRYRVCASCYSLPLQSCSVDFIVCRWLFEHLETPSQAMLEFSRVLKRGGFLYIKTPNLLNYTMMLSRATPVSFQKMFRSVTGQRENIPTFYRANTKRKLTKLATNSGFVVRRLESYSYSYMYYCFNMELFLTMRGLSKLVGRVLDPLQQTLMCVLEKV